jgi:hypothetical protein
MQLTGTLSGPSESTISVNSGTAAHLGTRPVPGGQATSIGHHVVDVMAEQPGSSTGAIRTRLKSRYIMPEGMTPSDIRNAVDALYALDAHLSVSMFVEGKFGPDAKEKHERVACNALNKINAVIQGENVPADLADAVSRSRDSFGRAIKLLEHSDTAKPWSIVAIGAAILPHCKILRDLLLGSGVGDAKAGSREARLRHLRRVELQEYLIDKGAELKEPRQWANRAHRTALRASAWAGITSQDVADLGLLSFSEEAGDPSFKKENQAASKLALPALMFPRFGRHSFYAACPSKTSFNSRSMGLTYPLKECKRWAL